MLYFDAFKQAEVTSGIGNPKTLFDLGEQLSEKREWSQAIKIFEKVLTGILEITQ